MGSAFPVATTTSDVVVQSRDTVLGKVLVSASSHTLYGLMHDTKTNSTCSGACAQTWPPVHTATGWTVASRSRPLIVRDNRPH